MKSECGITCATKATYGDKPLKSDRPSEHQRERKFELSRTSLMSCPTDRMWTNMDSRSRSLPPLLFCSVTLSKIPTAKSIELGEGSSVECVTVAEHPCMEYCPRRSCWA